MRLISLNTWALRVYEPLITFVKEQAATTDIFCFQEVYHTTSDQTHVDEPPGRADGQSLAILEEGMKNLIKEYGVTDTRSSLYTKPIRFADYILVSPEIRINNFKVLAEEVSDHLPMVLEFE
jgi:exonuclease III